MLVLGREGRERGGEVSVALEGVDRHGCGHGSGQGSDLGDVGHDLRIRQRVSVFVLGQHAVGMRAGELERVGSEIGRAHV